MHTNARNECPSCRARRGENAAQVESAPPPDESWVLLLVLLGLFACGGTVLLLLRAVW